MKVQGGSGDEVVTPFMTHTIKLPMRQQISGFWDSLPRLVSFCSTHASVFSLRSVSLVSPTMIPSEEGFSMQPMATHSSVSVHPFLTFSSEESSRRSLLQLRSMEKMLFGQRGIFQSNTAGGHWKSMAERRDVTRSYYTSHPRCKPAATFGRNHYNTERVCDIFEVF